jgi:hypothetical protein
MLNEFNFSCFYLSFNAIFFNIINTFTKYIKNKNHYILNFFNTFYMLRFHCLTKLNYGSLSYFKSFRSNFILLELFHLDIVYL